MIAASLLLGLAVTESSYAQKTKQQRIVGAWNYTEGPFEGVLLFNEDGTCIDYNSRVTTQEAGSSPFLTISLGRWEKIVDHSYSLISSAVIRDIYCTALAPVNQPDSTEPACPFIRCKREVILTIAEDCMTANAVTITSFHPLDDLSISKPVPAPFGPIPAQTATLTARKFTK